MQHHFAPRSLGSFKEASTRFVPSFEPSGTVVVFVHGFNGDAVGTWRSFDTLVSAPSFQGVDFIFYGYESVRTNPHANAALLYQFLDLLFADGTPLLNRALRKYEGQGRREGVSRLILVGHSLGAALCRQIAIYAFDEARPWRTQIKLLLFAPAHLGSHVPRLILGAGGGAMIRSLLEGLTQFRAPAITELREDSLFIKKLQRDTERLLHAHPNPPLKATTVVLCHNDPVVVSGRFCQDPAPRVLRRTHIDVCKPDPTFLEPIIELEALL
jgi:pimeloyl-ACP methyl ester carboxylesterase